VFPTEHITQGGAATEGRPYIILSSFAETIFYLSEERYCWRAYFDGSIG